VAYFEMLFGGSPEGIEESPRSRDTVFTGRVPNPMHPVPT
jgi:hypothetical protein